MRPQANGCGPKGAVGRLIPDGLLGVSVHEACNLHDKHYSEGGNSQDRKTADKIFLSNMLREVEEKSRSSFLKTLRKWEAYLYFWSVRIFGRLFFNQKNKFKT
jgi:hypothetical protein